MDLEPKSRLQKIINAIDQLPTLPTVYNYLQKMLSDPKVSAKDVGMVIEQDQALAVKILKVVNSSYYGFPRKVSTISHSVVLLGFNEIKHMALSVSLLKMFMKNGASGAFDYPGFWRHSVAVAVCAGVIGRKAGQAKCASHEEAFVAGLLHDIGKVIEEQFLHDDFTKVIAMREQENLSLFEAEKRLLGITHQEAGSYLAEKWRLPNILESAIGFHHDPLGKRSSPAIFAMASIIHCADVIVRAVGLGSGGDPFVPPLHPECWRELGLGLGHVEMIVDETMCMFNEVSKLLLEE
jgi:putative nucleotidyltransferase with HDIG domain